MILCASAARAVVLTLVAGQAVPTTLDVPALITKPTAESRAEVARAVSKALNGAVVPLADDALVRESGLVVEGARLRASSGALVPGRETRSPEHFRLVKNGARCMLVLKATCATR